MNPPCSLAASHCSRAPRERLRSNCLGFLLDPSQMVLAEEALGINLVNLFRARRARRKPTILCDHLNTANRVAVSGSCGQNLLDLFASNLGYADIGWGQSLECAFLFRRGGSIHAFVNRIPQVPSEFTVDFAGISPQTRRDFRREQTRDDSVFVSCPHATVAPKKRGARALFARETQPAS